MPSKSKKPVGPLTKDEKVYIFENFNTKTIEELAVKLSRKLSVVQTYLEKFGYLTKEVEPPKVEEVVKKPNEFVTKVGVATVYTNTGVAIISQKTKNPFSTR